MKNNLLTRLFFVSALFGPTVSEAQLVGSEAFLQGDFVEVGIATNGAFGTDGDAPAGYHPRGVGLKLGFVADPAKDGWTVGVPTYIGDYYLPGSPQEGWDMEYNGTWAQAWRAPGGGTSFTGGLTGSCINHSSTGTYQTGTWQGTLGAIKIKAITKLKKDKVYFTTTVQLTNTSGATMYNIYYNRTVDPDNEQTLTGSFTTKNIIKYTLPNPGNKSLVTATGETYGAYLGLGSRDCRVKPYIVRGSLWPQDSLHKLFENNPYPDGSIVTLDSLFTADVGIGLAFKIDSLRPGDSTFFSYAYILREADLDSAFEDLKPIFSIGAKPYISNDTVKACEGLALPIDILNGDFYDWTWSPGTGLSTVKGAHVVLTVGTTPITYTITPAPNSLCPIDPLTLTVAPVPNPPKPIVVTPIYYCQFDGAAPLTATSLPGATLNYYTAATGGPALSTLTPNTLAAGSKYYYVSQVNAGLCESARERIEVITRPIPVITNFTSTDPTYCGATDGTITFVADSANMVYTLTYDKDGAPVTPITITTDNTGSYTLTGLSGGSYSGFIVINKYGCKSAPFYGPVDLVDPSPPGPPISNNGPLCVDRIAVLSAPFIAGATYKWTGPDGFTSTDRNPSFTTTETSGGTYVLRVQIGSCIYQPSVTTLVIAPTPKHQKFNQVYPVCERTRLNIDIIREPAVTHEWSGNGISLIDQPLVIEDIQRVQSGVYTLTATSDFGCVTVDSLVVQVDKRPSFALTPDTTICSVDSASLMISSDAQNVAWTPVNGLSDSTAFSIKARPAATTTYTGIARSGNTCPDTSGKVKVTVIPTPSVTGYDTLVRMNIPYKIMPTYGQDVIKWKWVPSDSLSCSDCPNPTFNSSWDIRYIVYGSNQYGCTGWDTVMMRVFCDGANVTMPNAFTPNGDGTNDVFYVRGTGFSVKSFRIFNRLGQEVFSKEKFMPNDPAYGWDGTFKGQPVSDAAGFVYMLEAVCFNSLNAPILIKGTVLMIK